MTPLIQQMTAAAVVPAAMAAETWARLASGAARQWGAMLPRGDGADRPATRPEEALDDAQRAALDRAADALEETAAAVEGAAADLVEMPDDDGADGPVAAEAGEANGQSAKDRLAEPPADRPSKAGAAELRPVDGTLTAADDVAEMVEAAPEAAVDTAAVVEQATGRPPRSLDDMIPANDHPAE